MTLQGMTSSQGAEWTYRESYYPKLSQLFKQEEIICKVSPEVLA